VILDKPGLCPLCLVRYVARGMSFSLLNLLGFHFANFILNYFLRKRTFKAAPSLIIWASRLSDANMTMLKGFSYHINSFSR